MCLFCFASESDITPEHSEGWLHSVPWDVLSGMCWLGCSPATGQNEQVVSSRGDSPAFALEMYTLLCPGILESTQGVSQLGLCQCQWDLPNLSILPSLPFAAGFQCETSSEPELGLSLPSPPCQGMVTRQAVPSMYQEQAQPPHSMAQHSAAQLGSLLEVNADGEALAASCPPLLQPGRLVICRPFFFFFFFSLRFSFSPLMRFQKEMKT